MRFIHMADVHLGAVPDSGCPWSAFRENEIWETFVRVIDQIREEKIELLLIAGDLFHRQPLPSQTERVSQLFASIPDTEVVWMAGSHDYLREDSAYRKVKWTKNVHGFLSEKPEVISLEKLHTKVYGCSYEHPEVTEAIWKIASCASLLREYRSHRSYYSPAPVYGHSTRSLLPSTAGLLPFQTHLQSGDSCEARSFPHAALQPPSLAGQHSSIPEPLLLLPADHFHASIFHSLVCSHMPCYLILCSTGISGD